MPFRTRRCAKDQGFGKGYGGSVRLGYQAFQNGSVYIREAEQSDLSPAECAGGNQGSCAAQVDPERSVQASKDLGETRGHSMAGGLARRISPPRDPAPARGRYPPLPSSDGVPFLDDSMSPSRIFDPLRRSPAFRWVRAHRLAAAVGLTVALALLAIGAIVVGLWRALPPGPEYRRALVEAPLSARVIDRAGLTANLPLGAGAPTYTPVVSLAELPDGFLDELRAFEGMPRSGVHLGGLGRFIRGKEGAAPIQAQVHRRLWELHFGERYGGGLWGKLTQFVSAVKMSTSVEQDDILAFYVNHVQVVPGAAAGFEAAARDRFSKPASALTPPEWRLLMACVTYPVSCGGEAPTEGREAAFRAKTELAAARGWVLAASLEAHLVVPAFATDGEVFYSSAGPMLARASDEAAQILDAGGWDAGRDGLTVTLSADLALTDSLTALLERSVDGIDGARFASALVLDPTGGIVAYAVGAPEGAGGRVRQRGMFDALDADRGHPASVIKVFAYAALAEHYLERGVPADSIATMVLPNRWTRPDGVEVSPGCGGAPELTLAEAVACSANGVAAYAVNEMLGVDAFAAFLGRFGIDAEPHWSLALGVVDVPAVDLAAGLASILAQDGQRVWPHLVESVRQRDGASVYDASRWAWPTRQVVDPRAARVVRQMLAGTVQQGGTVRRLLQASPEAAEMEPRFKTGTSSGSSYRWLTVAGTVLLPGTEGRHTVLVRVEGEMAGTSGRVVVPALAEVLRRLRGARLGAG